MPTKNSDDAPQTAPADAPGSEFLTEQVKSAPDPVSPPVEPGKAEPVTVGPKEPYPTGGATAAQGVPHNMPPVEEQK